MPLPPAHGRRRGKPPVSCHAFATTAPFRILTDCAPTWASWPLQANDTLRRCREVPSVLRCIRVCTLRVGDSWWRHEVTEIHSPFEDGNLGRRKSCIPQFLRLPLRAGGPFEGLDIASPGLVQHLLSLMHRCEPIQHLGGKLQLLFGAALIGLTEIFQGVLVCHD